MLFSVIWVLFGNFLCRSWRNNNYLFNYGPTGTVLTNLPIFVYTFYFHSISGFHYSCKTIFILPWLKILPKDQLSWTAGECQIWKLGPFSMEKTGIFFLSQGKNKNKKYQQNLLFKCVVWTACTHSELSSLSSDCHFLLQTGSAAFVA